MMRQSVQSIPPGGDRTPKSDEAVFYDKRVRWVAAINLAFVVGGIWFSVRVVPGFGKYFMIVFLSLFSLFWIKDFLFGFRLMLISDGRVLNWKESVREGSVEIKDIQKVLVGVGIPSGRRKYSPTYIRLQQAYGNEVELPPNIAAGLRARDWRGLRKLLDHIRTATPVVVEGINDPDMNIEGWTGVPGKADEHGAEGQQNSEH